MTAAIREAFNKGFSAKWVNGVDLFGMFRKTISDDDYTEETLIKRLSTPSILAISDPVPPLGSLTDYQAGMMFRVIDTRYRNLKPTWITVNATDAKELEERMTPQIVDRLKDGALAIFCNWESYRKVKS